MMLKESGSGTKNRDSKERIKHQKTITMPNAAVLLLNEIMRQGPEQCEKRRLNSKVNSVKATPRNEVKKMHGSAGSQVGTHRRKVS